MKKMGKRLTGGGIFISIMSALSKVLGIIREIALAYFFGTTKLIDAYRIATTAVFLPLHTFAGFALNDSLIPTFKNLWTNNKRRLLWILINQLSFFLIGFGILLVLFEEFFTTQWIRLLAPGFESERVIWAVKLTRWMALVIPFYTISSLAVIILNSFYIFKTPSLRPLIQNLFLLVGIYFTVKCGSVAPLGQAYPVAFIFLFLLLLPLIKKRWKFNWSNKLSRIRKVWSYYLAAFFPLLIFVFIQRLNFLADKMISSFLAVGSIAALEYSRFIIETPVTTVGLGLVQVILPFYSDLDAMGKKEELLKNVKIILYFSLIIMVPLSLLLWVEARDVIKIIFGYGAFKNTSVTITASTLEGFSFGMWAWFSTYFLQRVYSAQRRNGQLLLFAAFSLGCNIIFNIILSRLIGIKGIAVATSISYVLFFILLIFFLDREFVKQIFQFLVFLLIGAIFIGFGLSELAAHICGLLQRIVILTLLGGIGWICWLMIFNESRTLLGKVISVYRRGNMS